MTSSIRRKFCTLSIQKVRMQHYVKYASFFKIKGSGPRRSFFTVYMQILDCFTQKFLAVLCESQVKNMQTKFIRNFGRKNPDSKKAVYREHFNRIVYPLDYILTVYFLILKVLIFKKKTFFLKFTTALLKSILSEFWCEPIAPF